MDLHESQQGKLKVAPIVTTILATLFVALRFWTRMKYGLGVGSDDYLILLALLFLFGNLTLELLMIRFGMGLHTLAVDPESLVQAHKTFMAFECIYCTNLVIIKLSLLLMYTRIFPVRKLRIGAAILGGITLAWGIGVNLVSIFQCTPIHKTWHNLAPGHCINSNAFYYGNAIPNIFTDIAILCLPMPYVWRLQASLMRRLSLIVVFLLGAFVIFTSIYRFVTLFQFNPLDFTWTVGVPLIWSGIECAMGIISACLPTLRPLFRMLAGSNNQSSGPHSGPAREITGTLVTIGGHVYENGTYGANNAKQNVFQRFGDKLWRQYNATTLVSETTVTAVDANKSSDQIPLQGIQVKEQFGTYYNGDGRGSVV